MSKKSESAYKAWATIYKKIYNLTEEGLIEFLQNRYHEKLQSEERKRIRTVIIRLGGVCDKDYEDIPIWARRKSGRQLDEVALELQEIFPEYTIEDANDVFKFINLARGQ